MYDISDIDITRQLQPYGLMANTALCAKIRSYIALLLRWNARMSLTTVTDPAEMVRFHFGESIFAFTSGLIREGRLADVGSGAGFPGIPLHLAYAGIRVDLIESNIKKCAFLKEVIRKLDIEKAVCVWQGRMEDFEQDGPRSRFDYISARAVGKFDELIVFAKNNLKKEGRLVLWVGENDAKEISSNHSKEFEWYSPVRIPQSDKRFLISGRTL
jgi:16S rRNA (guanine527-N7)-methyltransferase